jgi:alpha-N-arabinofuranosidase
VPTRPPYGDQPKTNSGSPTYPLDVAAALTGDRKYLTLAVVNATEQERPFTVSVQGMKVSGPGSAWQLTASELNADNHVGQLQEVFVKETPLSAGSGSITVPRSSVDLYRFPVQ